MRTAKLLLLAFPGFLMAQSAVVQPTVAADRVQQVAMAVNDFGALIHRQLSDQPGNRFFSPYSVAVALAMARCGAEGQTAAEMDRILGTVGVDASVAYQQLHQVIAPQRLLRSGRDQEVPAYVLDVAQRVWLRQGLVVEPAFARAQQEHFASPLAFLDFHQTETAREAINTWVAEHTHDRIRDIVPPGLPKPDTRLVLANAIYFKAAWAEEFSPKLTKEADFTVDGDSVRKVPMMHRQLRCRHASWDGGDAVEIPFAGGETALWVFLPPVGGNLATAAAQWNSKGIAELDRRLASRHVDLQLPRLTFTDAHDLREILQSLGMQRAFQYPGAEFGGITRQEPLMLGAVLHKAFLAVDEKGAEAAAATVMMVKPGSAARPEDPVAFHANRPFWFAIRHRATGCLLFVGRYVMPEASSRG